MSALRRSLVGCGSSRPDRHGKVCIAGYFDPAVRRSIRMIQAKHPELTQQDIIAEALNLVFAHYGVPQTAPAKKEVGGHAMSSYVKVERPEQIEPGDIVYEVVRFGNRPEDVKYNELRVMGVERAAVRAMRVGSPASSRPIKLAFHALAMRAPESVPPVVQLRAGAFGSVHRIVSPSV